MAHIKLYEADEYSELTYTPDKLGLALTLNLKSFQKLKPSDYNVYENFDFHMKRAKHIMYIAMFNWVDILICRAFGWGH